jgi:hypothetical protein
MLEILMHANVSKVDDVFTARVRTEEAGLLIAKKAKEKGMKVNILVTGTPHYFKSKQEHFDYLLQNNPKFKEFSDELGLKLII